MLNQGIFLKKAGLHFLSPWEPTGKACIEVFNSRLRQEYLSLSCFPSMGDADTQINDWATNDTEISRPSRLEHSFSDETHRVVGSSYAMGSVASITNQNVNSALSTNERPGSLSGVTLLNSCP